MAAGRGGVTGAAAGGEPGAAPALVGAALPILLALGSAMGARTSCTEGGRSGLCPGSAPELPRLKAREAKLELTYLHPAVWLGLQRD